MIKDEKQYKIARSKLEKWLKTREQMRVMEQPVEAEWIAQEQTLSGEEQIRQLQAELKEYEDTSLVGE
ncbi:MAG: hypothetical protein JST01_27760 [Cyanobacteria bacterium SZAS TMP-1]|nr:hypothetical protein [Cyanobacteria bacterium SZAS TMP-1]